MPTLEIIKGLVDIGSALFDLGKAARDTSKDARSRLAELYLNIADSLEEVVAGAKQKDWTKTTSKCEELGGYLASFSELPSAPRIPVPRGSSWENTFDTLTDALASAIYSRRGFFLAQTVFEADDPDVEKHLLAIAAVAGKFRAAGNLLREA